MSLFELKARPTGILTIHYAGTRLLCPNPHGGHGSCGRPRLGNSSRPCLGMHTDQLCLSKIPRLVGPSQSFNSFWPAACVRCTVVPGPTESAVGSNVRFPSKCRVCKAGHDQLKRIRCSLMGDRGPRQHRGESLFQVKTEEKLGKGHTRTSDPA
ncbi:uncharacterized protein K452DRAFT_88359 [Aplosporella prunicola CBS 121167]|uniref:Uncharacterized protein n=1 Tax=Aplosporella prunicola CBS 121167 TaxID=1176127 RepID=A0A6A6B4J3_9PEZI|nr:uncharacterized protein K452DRAFT_88359 [Aplosporella prunicola CBS 121167]KAF2138558.1 hypothetical protein K452DRAFT_88359 [Aplosporella prunicola CBS 121167]